MENEIVKINETELSKVENNLLNADQLKFLFARTPEGHTYQRPAKGGGTWKYVTGIYVKKVLNLMFGWAWNFTVDKFDVNMEAKQVIVLGRLVVKTSGQEIIKMQFGRADIKFKKDTKDPMDLGNDLKAATTDALKKCASELGIAADIYGINEFKEIQVISESEKSDIEKAQKKIIDALDTYQGDDKKGIQDMCKNKVLSGEFDMKFAENVAERLNLEL